MEGDTQQLNKICNIWTYIMLIYIPFISIYPNHPYDRIIKHIQFKFNHSSEFSNKVNIKLLPNTFNINLITVKNFFYNINLISNHSSKFSNKINIKLLPNTFNINLITVQNFQIKYKFNHSSNF